MARHESNVNFHLLERMDKEDYVHLTRLLVLPQKYSIGQPEAEWLDKQRRTIEGMKRDNLGPTRSFGLRNKIGIKMQSLMEKVTADLPREKNVLAQLLPPNATLCEAHRRLNPWLLREIFNMIVEECTRRTQWLRRKEFMDEDERLPEHMRKHVAYINAASLLWCDESLARSTFDGRGDGYYICNDFAFERVRSGCEACILAVIGGTANFLVHLKATIVGRRAGCKKKRRPAVVAIIDSWMRDYEDTRDIMRDAKTVADQVADMRKRCIAHYRNARRLRRTAALESHSSSATTMTTTSARSARKSEPASFRSRSTPPPLFDEVRRRSTSASASTSMARRHRTSSSTRHGSAAPSQSYSDDSKSTAPQPAAANKTPGSRYSFDDCSGDEEEEEEALEPPTAAELKARKYFADYRQPYLDDDEAIGDEEAVAVAAAPQSGRGRNVVVAPEGGSKRAAPAVDDGSVLGFYSNASRMSLYETRKHLHPAFIVDEDENGNIDFKIIPEETDEDGTTYSHPSCVPQSLAINKTSSSSSSSSSTPAATIRTAKSVPLTKTNNNAAAAADFDDTASQWTDITTKTSGTISTGKRRTRGRVVAEAHGRQGGGGEPAAACDDAYSQEMEEMTRPPVAPMFYHTSRRSDVRPAPGDDGAVLLPSTVYVEPRARKNRRVESIIRAKNQVYSSESYAASSIYSEYLHG